MPMNPLGVSFSPFSQDKGDQNAAANQTPTPQDAVKILALRLPRVVGAGAPAPQSLLGGNGAAGLGGMFGGMPGGLEEMLRRVVGPIGGRRGGTGSAPVPRFDFVLPRRPVPAPIEGTYQPEPPDRAGTPPPQEPAPIEPPPPREGRDRRV